eukprot:766690-Prymnesium_polylepis.2
MLDGMIACDLGGRGGMCMKIVENHRESRVCARMAISHMDVSLHSRSGRVYVGVEAAEVARARGSEQHFRVRGGIRDSHSVRPARGGPYVGLGDCMAAAPACEMCVASTRLNAWSLDSRLPRKATPDKRRTRM